MITSRRFPCTLNWSLALQEVLQHGQLSGRLFLCSIAIWELRFFPWLKRTILSMVIRLMTGMWVPTSSRILNKVVGKNFKEGSHLAFDAPIAQLVCFDSSANECLYSSCSGIGVLMSLLSQLRLKRIEHKAVKKVLKYAYKKDSRFKWIYCPFSAVIC